MTITARSFAAVIGLLLALPLHAAVLTEIATPDRVEASFSVGSLHVVNLWAT